jgi:SAM-dependent methyltransferase
MVSHQEKSEIYWKNTSNSHLAAPEYYEKKKKILEVIISHIPAAHSTLDIGCGNGEYTSMFLPKSEKIVGYDISPGLLDVARQNFAHEPKMTFHCATVDEISPDQEKFNTILCMGVTSCIIDDEKFNALVKKMVHLASNNAFIIMGDSLSHHNTLSLEDQSGYVAKYRDLHLYQNTFISEGLRLVSDIKVMDGYGGKTTNNLMLFWKK